MFLKREYRLKNSEKPFIQEYSESDVSWIPELILPLRESRIHSALHETPHVVIGILSGLEIEVVVDQDDAVWTRLVEPHKFNVAALMAPEVYMNLFNIAYTELSVSSDRDAVTDCFCPEAIEDIRRANREWLEMVFKCPYVRRAIGILSVCMDAELRKHKRMSGTYIHEIVDPILKYSAHADDLREKLNR